MTRGDFVAYRYPGQPNNPAAGSPDDLGYLVTYLDSDGYQSWSPKAVFDAGYTLKED